MALGASALSWEVPILAASQCRSLYASFKGWPIIGHEDGRIGGVQPTSLLVDRTRRGREIRRQCIGERFDNCLVVRGQISTFSVSARVSATCFLEKGRRSDGSIFSIPKTRLLCEAFQETICSEVTLPTNYSRF